MAEAYRAMTIARGIRCAAARAPAKDAIVHGARRLSYGRLSSRIAQVANAAIGAGLAAGDRVALVAPNCLEYAEIVAGLSETGVIVATLSPRLTPAELEGIMTDCEPRLVILHPDCAALETAAGGTGVPVVVIGRDYEQWIGKARDSMPETTVAETAAFALAYTSGTTGLPKGVLLSHRSRAITFMAMAAEYGCFGPDDNFLAMTPMCHGAGFVFSTASLFFGGTTTLFDWGDPEAFLARLASLDVTGVFMVPTHFARLFAPSRTLPGAHALKAIISNAAALPQPMKEACVAHFGAGLLHETYGSTEGGIVTNIRPADVLRKPGSVGVPFANVEVSLRDEAGDEAAPDEPGELFCRGPTGFSGYWRRAADTTAAVREGWVTVGDVATRDADGFITIVDRKSDMVVTGGLNVFPREVERVIERMEGVRDVAVVGLPDDYWGERLHAVIVPDPRSPPSPDDVLEHCREKLAAHKVPKDITMKADLPRNPSGKLLRRALRDDLLRNQLAKSEV